MHRWVDHTAEVELEVHAATEEDVLAEAVTALRELLEPGEPPGEAPERRTVSLTAEDRPALLAAWIEELAFLAETQGFVPVRAESVALGAGGLTATVAGRRGDPPHLVKAVTYHRLEFEPDGEGHRARVVLDV